MSDEPMSDGPMNGGRFPGYDVMAKRQGPSWNEITRRVIDARLATPREPRFLDAAAFLTLGAIAARIMPQPPGRAPVPIAAMIDAKLLADKRDGYRNAALPPLREAWRRGLAATDAEARARHSQPFAPLYAAEQDAILSAMQAGRLTHEAWAGMPPALFFSARVTTDILHAYYGFPVSWNEIGFGGPASPRGYVRMDANRRDPWEAAEAPPGTDPEPAARKNRNVR